MAIDFSKHGFTESEFREVFARLGGNKSEIARVMKRDRGFIIKVAHQLGLSSPNAKYRGQQVQVVAPPPAPVDPQAELFRQFQQFLQAQGVVSAPVVEPAPVASEPKGAVPPQSFVGQALIFTAFEARVKINEKFVDILEQIRAYHGGQKFLTLTTPEDVQFIPPHIKSQFQIVTESFKANENLWFRYCRTNALNKSVCSKYSSAFAETAIIPGLINEMITLPIPGSQTTVKKIYTTGSIGYLDADITDYSHIDDEFVMKRLESRFNAVRDRRLGATYAVAQRHVVPSALVVHVVSDKVFFAYRVSMREDGVVYSLNRKFTAGKKSPELSRPVFLNVGDSHLWDKSETALQSSIRMIDGLKPAGFGLNDVSDRSSSNRHEMRDAACRVSAPKLAEERIADWEGLDRYYAAGLRNDSIMHWMGDNHSNWLPAYLSNKSLWNETDKAEYLELLELEYYRVSTGKHPIIKHLDLENRYPKMVYVPENEDLMVAGAAGRHGHVPIGGARVPSFDKAVEVYNSYFQAHTHSPRELRNALCAGHTTNPSPSYVKGASASCWENSLIQPDGCKQSLFIAPDGTSIVDYLLKGRA